MYGGWEKQGFVKVAVSRAVRLREFALGEFPLYEDIISHSYSKICGKILFTIFTQTIMHLVLPHPTKKIYMHNQNLGGGGKQGTLWSMEKWWIMLPFKLNLSGRSLAWYHLFFLGFYQRKLKIYIIFFSVLSLCAILIRNERNNIIFGNTFSITCSGTVALLKSLNKIKYNYMSIKWNSFYINSIILSK